VRAPRQRQPRIGWAAAFLGVACVLALLAAFLYHQTLRAPVEVFNVGADRFEKWMALASNALEKTFGTAFQPRVTIGNRVVFEQASPALELTVVERPTVVERELNATFLGSTKRVRLRGEFLVKAGFDLRQPFSAQLDRAEKPGAPPTVRVTVPPARILGVESRRIEVLELQNGFWNRVQPGELEGEINSLAAQARSKAHGAHLPHDAEVALATQLRERLGPDCHLDLRFGEPAVPSPTAAPSPTTGIRQ